MPLSLADEADIVVWHRSLAAIWRAAADRPRERAAESALRARRRHGVPFPAGRRLVLSHAVIEHVSDASLYLRECARVLRRVAACNSNAPLLSFAGPYASMKVPVRCTPVWQGGCVRRFQFLAHMLRGASRNPRTKLSSRPLARRAQAHDCSEVARAAPARADRGRGLRVVAKAARNCHGAAPACGDRAMAARQRADADALISILSTCWRQRHGGSLVVPISIVTAGGQEDRRSALPPRVRQRRSGSQPPPLGLAVPPQPQQSRSGT